MKNNRIRMFLILIAFCSMIMFGCEDETNDLREAIGTVGCSNPTARDNCGSDTHCRMVACEQ